jgi:hypothetical protein
VAGPNSQDTRSRRCPPPRDSLLRRFRRLRFRWCSREDRTAQPWLAPTSPTRLRPRNRRANGRCPHHRSKKPHHRG